MTDKVQKIKEYLVGMAGAACYDAKTKKVIKANILPFIDSLQEEPVSEDLDMEIDYYLRELQSFKSEHGIDCYTVSIEDMDEICRHFAEWQKEQDQSIIELAEDHAMFAGMEKMREQIMKDAIDGICISNGAECGSSIQSSAGMLFLQHNTLDVGDKVKIIIVKDD